jgi:hypothetical protein
LGIYGNNQCPDVKEMQGSLYKLSAESFKITLEDAGHMSKICGLKTSIREGMHK